jgi:hypothetical protein
MKEIEIIKIKPANLAFIVSAFYFFGGILTALISLTLTLGSSPYYYGVPYIIRTLIYFLILFPVVGFILGFLFAFIYNFVAKYTGGIKVMIREDVDSPKEGS